MVNVFEFHSSRKITSLTKNKEDSILTLFTLEVLERPPIIVYVSFGSYSFTLTRVSPLSLEGKKKRRGPGNEVG